MEPRGSALTIVTHLSWQQLLGLLLLPIALWLLWQLWVVAALLLLALIVAVGLNPAVAWVETRGVSRVSAVLGLYALILVMTRERASHCKAPPNLVLTILSVLDSISPRGG
ncbi:MAG: hypothetical protein M5U01_21195 [Ardenticatenaceae bacterium]|nr:hypothetical protein [Ardenticatenaceae bacterium]